MDFLMGLWCSILWTFNMLSSKIPMLMVFTYFAQSDILSSLNYQWVFWHIWSKSVWQLSYNKISYDHLVWSRQQSQGVCDCRLGDFQERKALIEEDDLYVALVHFNFFLALDMIVQCSIVHLALICVISVLLTSTDRRHF